MIVQYVMQASGVLVLEWRHLKNALMEHIVTQFILDTVFCVQKVIGEATTCQSVLGIRLTVHTCIRTDIILNIQSLSSLCGTFHSLICVG